MSENEDTNRIVRNVPGTNVIKTGSRERRQATRETPSLQKKDTHLPTN
jgi:hypothetical protein